MSFYNTGNPVPSIDPRDLDDNAKVLDGFVNGTENTYSDRKGVERRTLKGIEADAATLITLVEPGGANNLQVQVVGATHSASLKTRFGRTWNIIDDGGAIPGDAESCTRAFAEALARGGEIVIPAATYRIDHAQLTTLGLVALIVGDDTFLNGSLGAVIEIFSNQLADGTRFEMQGRNVEIANLIFKEVNPVLGRYNVYGTVSGNGCEDYTLRNVTVDGANGAGFHFRNGCKNMSASVIRTLNTKSDGYHIQRGCTGGVIVDLRGENNEDDVLAFVSHGRNSGWGPVSGFQAYGVYGGPQANGAVGSAAVVIGGHDISIYGLVGEDNGLSTLRVLPFKSASEGDYGCKNVLVPGLISRGAGKTTSVLPGLVRDGITLGGGINISIPDASVENPAGNCLSVVESGIDVNITNFHGTGAAGRGLWFATILQPITGGSAVGYLAELVADDERYAGATHVGFDRSVLDNVITECSGTDGMYLDGSATPSIRDGKWTNIKTYKPNMGNTAGKYSVFIRGTAGLELDGVFDDVTGSATAVNSLTFSNAPYTRISNLYKPQISTTYPSQTQGGRRIFFATAAPAIGAQPAVGPVYAFGDEIVNPGAGTLGWTYQGSGTGWVAKPLKVAAPATSTSSGAPGYFAVTSTFRYEYTGDGVTHSWVRVAVAAW
jgi:hypothetical protein